MIYNYNQLNIFNKYYYHYYRPIRTLLEYGVIKPNY